MSAQINLFNPALGKQKLAFSALEMSQMLGIVLLGVLLMTWYLHFQTSRLESQVTVSQEQLRQAQSRLAKVTAEYAPRSKNRQLETDIASLETQVKALEKVADLLQRGDFGNAKGYSSYLTAFARQSQEGLWLTHVSVGAAGKEVSLSGRTLQADMVPKYVQRLAAEPVLRGKSFARLDMQRLGDAPAVNHANTSVNNNPASNVASQTATPASPPVAAQPDPATQALLAQAGKLSAVLGQGSLNQIIGPLLKTAGVGTTLPTVPGPASGESGKPTGSPAGSQQNGQGQVGSTTAAPAAGVAAVRGTGSNAAGGNSPVIEFHLYARMAEGERK